MNCRNPVHSDFGSYTVNFQAMSLLRGACEHVVEDNSEASMVVTVRKNEVPAFLKNGDFYKSLEEVDLEITVPHDCFRTSPTAANSAELESLLKTLRFWVVSEIPDGLLDYAYDTRTDEDERIYASFENDLVYLAVVKKLADSSNRLLSAVSNAQITR